MNNDAQQFVASVLRREKMSSMLAETEGGGTLRSTMSRVDQFFAAANTAPPAHNLELDDSVTDGADTEIILNVLMGILEDKSAEGSGLRQVDGVTLPTVDNETLLMQSRMQESMNMLKIMAALTDTSSGKEDNSGKKKCTCDEETAGVAGAKGGDKDDGDDSSECVFMDYDNDESSSEDEIPDKKRKLVTELT